MTNQTLKSQATKGMFWTATENIFLQAGQFVIGIILARVLMPEDFGLIGMLSIFIAISQTFIDSGMGSGLIQKKDIQEIDFSTVFVFNFAVSVLFYFVLFFTAPLIADFYKMPQLVLLTRVLALNIIINSLVIVQRSKLKIALDFKSLAIANVISIVLGGLVALALAYFGWGVWALVMQTIATSVISVVLLWQFSHSKFSILFSIHSFKDLFGFGSKLLISGIYGQLFNNIYNIVIGKAYSAADLGYYTRSKAFAEMTSGTVTSILYQVSYPILASLQHDRDKLIQVYRRLIGMTSFFVFPAMTLLALLADPIVRILLTDKWIPVIVLLQWMCFARIFYPISVINMNILNAMGRSDLYLKVDLSKMPLMILALVITLPLGVKAMVIGHVIVSFIAFFINAYMPGKLFSYGGLQQLRDMLPIIIATSCMALLVWISIVFIELPILKIAVGSTVALSSYLVISKILKLPEFDELMELISKLKLKYVQR
jgi:O-antigen/teichoic acid export membrane protein